MMASSRERAMRRYALLSKRENLETWFEKRKIHSLHAVWRCCLHCQINMRAREIQRYD